MAIVVECKSCRQARLCPERLQSERHRQAAMAFAHDRDAPACLYYEPRWERGVDGVLDCGSPHPSRVFAGNQRS